MCAKCHAVPPIRPTAGGATVALLVAARDAAEARARDLARLDEDRRWFLAHAAHELRSPVNAIVILAELVRGACERRSWDELERRLPVLLRTAAALRTTLGAVLDLSALEAEKSPLVLEPVDLSVIVEDVAATAAVLATGKPLRVAAAALPRGELVVTTDGQKLTQILVNLASNAVKFTADGAVNIGAAACAGGGARVWVADTGTGIARDDLARLFAPFTRLERAGAPRNAGSGLGLAISGALAGAIGARIEVESEPGAGSTFSVVLPAR